MTRADNTHHLQRAAAARHDSALTRTRTAIQNLDRSGHPVTFSTVARAAGVSRSWLYSQSDLRDIISTLRHDNAAPGAARTPALQRATTDSLRQRLDSARHEIAHLRADNAALREQLARSLGAQRLHR